MISRKQVYVYTVYHFVINTIRYCVNKTMTCPLIDNKLFIYVLLNIIPLGYTWCIRFVLIINKINYEQRTDWKLADTTYR